jgi:chromosome segregation ATPase
VVKERPRGEIFALLDGDLGTLDVYSSTREIPQKVKVVLRNVGDKRKALMDLDRRIQQKQADRNQILQDEATIRANINTAPSNSKVYQDSVNDLSGKETERKQTDADIKSLQAAQEKARADLEAYVSDMTVE